MKSGYRVKANKHVHLKWVVRGKAHGQWARKYFTPKGEADTYAQIKNTELLNLGQQGAELPIELRLMAIDCQRRLAGFGKTILDAVNFYIPHLAKVQNTVSVRNLADEVVATKKANGIKESTLKVYRHRVKQFCLAFGESEVSGITAEDVGKWLVASFPHPVTRNNNRRVLVNLFNFAKSKKYIDSNPALETAVTKHVRKEVGILRPDQISQLLQHAPHPNPPLFCHWGICWDQTGRTSKIGLERHKMAAGDHPRTGGSEQNWQNPKRGSRTQFAGMVDSISPCNRTCLPAKLATII